MNLLYAAIENLDATEHEKDALADILDLEGFGGREDNAVDPASAATIVEERLTWYRSQREEGLR